MSIRAWKTEDELDFIAELAAKGKRAALTNYIALADHRYWPFPMDPARIRNAARAALFAMSLPPADATVREYREGQE